MKPNLAASIINCHVMGLDSIVFKLAAPMVRVYLAHEDHVLWRNKPETGNIMSLGFHEHRQDITMVPLFGNIYNVLIEKRRSLTPRTLLHHYAFHSHIAEGKGGFANLGKTSWHVLKTVPLTFPTFLSGDTVHSVYVPKGETAAWMICEGKKNDGYGSGLLTNDPNLELSDLSGVYQPITQERLDIDMTMLEER